MAALQPSRLRRANSKRQVLKDAAENEETLAEVGHCEANE